MEKKERPQERYDKANMAMVDAKYKKEFIAEFKTACKGLGIAQSEVKLYSSRKPIHRFLLPSQPV